jgi:hypothetical protein
MAATQPCVTEGCRGTAKGGHRYCRACLGQLLSQPQPPARLPQQSSITYPLPKKKR